MLNRLVAVLARSLHIRELTLVADKPQSLGCISVDTAGLLGRSGSLHTLRLYKMGIDDSHAAALAHSLRQNNTLRNLRVSMKMGQLGSLAMSSMLAQNISLEKFNLFLEMVEDEEAALHLARAMQSSTSLKHYNLSFDSDQILTSSLRQVHVDLKESKELAKEMDFSSTSLSNCPFIQLIHAALDCCLNNGSIAGTENRNNQQTDAIDDQ